jgi:hypothetical protein
MLTLEELGQHFNIEDNRFYFPSQEVDLGLYIPSGGGDKIVLPCIGRDAEKQLGVDLLDLVKSKILNKVALVTVTNNLESDSIDVKITYDPESLDIKEIKFGVGDLYRDGKPLMYLQVNAKVTVVNYSESDEDLTTRLNRKYTKTQEEIAQLKLLKEKYPNI